MLISLVIRLLRFLFVTVPRFALASSLYVLSIISKRVGVLGSFTLFRVVPFLPVRLVLSPETARILRDDFMTAMDGVVEAVIEQYFGEGHAQELVSQNLRDGLEHGEFVEPEQYNVGEFGVSLMLTFAALGLVYFEIPTGLAEALSLWIAVATFVLLFAVSIRTVLIDF